MLSLLSRLCKLGPTAYLWSKFSHGWILLSRWAHTRRPVFAVSSFSEETKKVHFLVETWVHYVRHSWQSCGHKSVVCPQHGGYTVRTYKKLKIHRISRFVVATFTTEKGISEIGFVFLGIRHFAWLLVDPIFGSHGDLEDTTYLS